MKQLKILYVEDDSLMALLVSDTLEYDDIEVEVESNSLTALSHIGCHHYDFVLLDVNVPPLKMTDFKDLLDKLGVHYVFCSASPDMYPNFNVWSKGEIGEFSGRMMMCLTGGFSGGEQATDSCDDSAGSRVDEATGENRNADSCANCETAEQQDRNELDPNLIGKNDGSSNVPSASSQSVVEIQKVGSNTDKTVKKVLSVSTENDFESAGKPPEGEEPATKKFKCIDGACFTKRETSLADLGVSVGFGHRWHAPHKVIFKPTCEVRTSDLC